jgi:hypothetical protein
VPVEVLTGAERQRHFRLQRQRDPLGERHPFTWRTLLIRVAAEVIVRTRRIVVRLGGIDECRVDLRKPKGGKVIGETGLAGEDGA